MLQLVTPAADRMLVTIEELRAAVGVTGVAEDDALKAQGRKFSDIVALECGVARAGLAAPTFLDETLRERIRAAGEAELLLSRRFVSEVVNIAVNGIEVEPDLYTLDGPAGLIAHEDACRVWNGTVIVTYRAGFPPNAVPEPLKDAVLLAVRERRSADSRDPLLRAETTDEVGRLEYQIGGSGRGSSSALPPAAAAALAPFLTVHVA